METNSRDRGKEQASSVQYTNIRLPGSSSFSKRKPHSICLTARKKHKQSFANYSQQLLLGTRPGRISPAGSEPRDSAFSQRYSPCACYRLSSIVHPSLRFQLLRTQSEVCQILLLSWQAIIRSKSDTADQSARKRAKTTACVGMMGEAKGWKGWVCQSFAVLELGFAWLRVVIQH